MSTSFPKLVLTLLSFFLAVNFCSAQSTFPNWDTASTFSKSLRSAALISSLPNTAGEDYYLGLRTSTDMILTDSDGPYLSPNARLSIYPNPGYNLWAQFGYWPSDRPAFSVGTGIHVELPSENQKINQGIGMSWNTVYGEDYSQRDISAHVLYGYSLGSFDFGLSAILDVHHILVEDSRGIPDYDETILQAVPYISWMLFDQSKLSLSLPLDAKGAALSFAYEYLLEKRN